ncbi:importin-13 [Alosa sapidissima]|uniref:importin-13 n=1 Tax=Alosa sapidissima TaxID=34773 RepID=UPI001C0A5FA2|nr:importin-13 [Alosa sapidissima]
MESGSAQAAEFTVEAVERALHQLYYDPDMAQKNVAQKWLTQAQMSPQAWHFCWALLSQDKVPEVQFFGASTLHAKISRSWSDLPTEQHVSLRTQLIAQVGHFASGPKMVLTRLCVALASLVLHTMPDSWPTALPDLLQAFQTGQGITTGADGRARCLAMLELLAVLPEEFQNSRVPAVRRTQLRSALAGQWSAVCPLLQQLLRQADSPTQVKMRVLRCLASWMALDVSLGDSEGLLQDSFSTLADPELFDTAVETIVSTISQPDSHRFADTLVKLVPQVLGLQDQLRKAVETGDMETSHGICRIAVALGETHCRTLLEHVDQWQGFQALVNMILFCTGIPGHYPVDETTSTLTLTFWYTLQDDILSFDADRQALYLQMYRPLYFQLVDVLLHKSHFPSDEAFASWSSDDKEQFRIYRVDISDTLMYVYDLLGPELLRNLYDRLGRLLTESGRTASWQDIEALLFGFQSIAETVDVSYSDVIPGLVGLIPLINVTNVELADTVMFTIGSLGEWLADHPLMLGGILPVVLQALTNPDLSVSSVSALKRICRECRYNLQPHTDNILAATQDVLVKQIHKSAQCMWLMQALGFLISALPGEQILGKLLPLLSPHLQQLEHLTKETPNPSNKSAIVHILGLLSSLFTTLDTSSEREGSEDMAIARPAAVPHPDPHPVVVILQQFFPLIQAVLSKWLTDSEVVEAACAIFDKSLKTLLSSFAPLVSQLSELVGQMYGAVPQAAALDLTRQLVHIFSGEKEHFGPVKTLLELLTSITLSIFQREPRDHPDIVDSFMQLHAQVLKRKAELYLSETLDIKALFYCGILSLKFPEKPTVKSTCLFFTELVPHCEDIPAVGEVLQEDGKLLLQSLLEGVGGQAPRSLMEYFAEVLLCLNRHCHSPMSVWLQEVMLIPNFPSARVSMEQKQTFSQQILREQTNKRHIREIVRDFSQQCRGLHGTEYAGDY